MHALSFKKKMKVIIYRIFYLKSDTYSSLRLQWFYPSGWCVAGVYDNTLVVTYDIAVNGPNITCAPTHMIEEYATYNTTTLVYLTVIDPSPNEFQSTGGAYPQPADDDDEHSSGGLSPLATCFIVGFTIVGVLAIAAACYVWRWRQLQTWESENQQRLMTSRFGVA
jgi:hypothetical protein